MSWSVEWGGRATDFIPELLKTQGKPGRVAKTAVDVIYEALQALGNQDAGAWAHVKANGHDDQENPGLGRMVVEITVMDQERSAIQDQIAAQQPVDLMTKPYGSGGDGGES